MKRAAQLLLFPVLILFLTGCGTSKSTALSQEEVQSITTRTYDENYDLVYKSILSAIANGGYLITNTDYQAGVFAAIVALNCETDFVAKNADFIEAMLAGVSDTNHNYKVSVLVNKLNEQQTKVHWTLFHYATVNYNDERKGVKSGGRTLIASQYQNWFSRVYDEIQKNKGAN